MFAAETQLAMRCSMDGVTFDTGATQYFFGFTFSTSTGAGGVTPGANAGYFSLSAAAGIITTTWPFYSVVRIYNSRIARFVTTWQATSHNSSGQMTNAVGGGEYINTIGTQVKGLRLFATSGATNIVRGTFKLFGIVK